MDRETTLVELAQEIYQIVESGYSHPAGEYLFGDKDVRETAVQEIYEWLGSGDSTAAELTQTGATALAVEWIEREAADQEG